MTVPLVLDLDGDGIELVLARRSRARFDANRDGDKDWMAWVGPDDGMLVFDRNGNGRVDGFSEISFAQDFKGAATDLQGLRAYDSDGDGFLTRADDKFESFLVWRDANGNGRSEKGELSGLTELGIVSLSLGRTEVSQLQADGGSSPAVPASVFETQGGRTGKVSDVSLFVVPTGAGDLPPRELSMIELDFPIG